jgi:hypothetical protein
MCSEEKAEPCRGRWVLLRLCLCPSGSVCKENQLYLLCSYPKDEVGEHKFCEIKQWTLVKSRGNQFRKKNAQITGFLCIEIEASWWTAAVISARKEDRKGLTTKGVVGGLGLEEQS